MEINKDFSNKKRLGRGLGSLLGGDVATEQDSFSIEKHNAAIAEKPQKNIANKTEAESAAPAEGRIWNISIDKLVPGVYQPRKNFEKEALLELANSIKENGIIQPITVRKRNQGGFEILAGERRWRAAQMAGLHEVPAIIKNIDDQEALQLALIENIQREDLDPIEEAESYQKLIELFSLSQQEAAEKVGKERSTVANALRLLGLPSEVREMVSKKQISTGHAKAILSIGDKEKQKQIAKKVIEKGYSVRALENEIKFMTKGAAGTAANLKSASHGLANEDIAQKLASELADQLQKTLGTKVEIDYKVGKGSVNIHFYTDEQLTHIYEKLKN